MLKNVTSFSPRRETRGKGLKPTKIRLENYAKRGALFTRKEDDNGDH